MSYTKPKFKRGDIVNAPKGVKDKIQHIAYEGGIHWYFVDKMYYSEKEISL